MKVKPSPKHGSVVMEVSSNDSRILSETPGGREASTPFRLARILVPIDFSECSRKALAYALPFAKRFGASLTLMHVVQVAYGGGEFGLIDVPLLETQIQESARRQLEEIAREAIPDGIAAEAHVRVGRPVHEIVELAKEKAIDLIIISTHGHTGLKHVLLGSTAENIVRLAPCPVLTVRQHEHEFISE